MATEYDGKYIIHYSYVSIHIKSNLSDDKTFMSGPEVSEVAGMNTGMPSGHALLICALDVHRKRFAIHATLSVTPSNSVDPGTL